ncbi:hypothetical protein IWZ03DRAFT_238987 [Phyllosticta citriasiana]|uniref:RING-type domain-containing protein n=2 Tax=Phyllosticta citriasiana TaxID=595635 RepID=A0ABR1KF96_9PEZI
MVSFRVKSPRSLMRLRSQDSPIISVSTRKAPPSKQTNGFIIHHAPKQQGKLPRSSTTDVCAICLEGGNGAKPTFNACGHGHAMCAACLIDWANTADDDGMTKDSCPVCRTRLCQAERLRDVEREEAENGGANGGGDGNGGDGGMDFGGVLARLARNVVVGIANYLLRGVHRRHEFNLHNVGDVAYVALVVSIGVCAIRLCAWLF